MKWRGARHSLVTELKESRTWPMIVSDKGRKAERCESVREARRRETRGGNWLRGAARASPGMETSFLHFSPTALGSVSIRGRRRDTEQHTAGSIRSNHIPLQLKKILHTQTNTHDQEHDTDAAQSVTLIGRH